MHTPARVRPTSCTAWGPPALPGRARIKRPQQDPTRPNSRQRSATIAADLKVAASGSRLAEKENLLAFVPAPHGWEGAANPQGRPLATIVNIQERRLGRRRRGELSPNSGLRLPSPAPGSATRRISMHVFVPTKRRLRKAPITAVLAAACTVGLLLSAGVDRDEAGKGRGNKALTWGATKAPGSKVVRDHRTPSSNSDSAPGGVNVPGGGRVVGAPPHGPRPGSGGCARWPNTPSCHPIVRDHRGPRVVPKEDPRQKW